MTQRVGSDRSLSPGARFSLCDFTGENYSRGRPWPVRLLWMLVSRCGIVHLERVVIGSNTCIFQDVSLCTDSHNRFSQSARRVDSRRHQLRAARGRLSAASEQLKPLPGGYFHVGRTGDDG